MLTGSPIRPRARLATFAVDHDVWVHIVGAADQAVATAAVRPRRGRPGGIRSLIAPDLGVG